MKHSLPQVYYYTQIIVMFFALEYQIKFIIYVYVFVYVFYVMYLCFFRSFIVVFNNIAQQIITEA